jgi:hypothetical protein
MGGEKEWQLGLPGYADKVSLEEVVQLARDGKLRSTDLVKKTGEQWRATSEIPEIAAALAPKPEESPGSEKKEEGKPAAAEAPKGEPKADAPKKSRFSRLGSFKDQAVAAVEKAEESARKLAENADPMAPREIATADLLPLAARAFEARRLLITLILVAPVCVLASLLGAIGDEVSKPFVRAFFDRAAVIVGACGAGVALTALGYVTRRQIEGKEYGISGTLRYAASNAVTGLVCPALSLAALLVLWTLGLFRNASGATATVLGILYFLPLALAVVAVLGFLGPSMLLTAAAAVEGARLRAAIRSAFDHLWRQKARARQHLLMVVAAAGAVFLVFTGLGTFVIHLPERVFPELSPEKAVAVMRGWSSVAVVVSIYTGVVWGLALTPPVSALSMFGAIAYLSLRSAPQASPPPPPPPAPAPSDKTDVGPAAV